MSTDNPWRKTGSRLVYENPWIRVIEDQVIGPDDKPSVYGIVECHLAAGVVALTADGEVVLVGQYRYPLRAYSWEIIEGATHEGEEPLDAAKRELAEEAGLVAGHWEPLGNTIYVANAHSTEGAKIWLATDLSPAADAKPDATEILTVARVPFATCVERVVSGDIDDAISIIGILRAQAVLASRGRP
jgi:8-oxo-dGTP pyrophosphatase MutT (NUDIX family)